MKTDVTEVRPSGYLWFATVTGKAAEVAAVYGVKMPWAGSRYSFTNEAWKAFLGNLN